MVDVAEAAVWRVILVSRRIYKKKKLEAELGRLSFFLCIDVVLGQEREGFWMAVLSFLQATGNPLPLLHNYPNITATLLFSSAFTFLFQNWIVFSVDEIIHIQIAICSAVSS